MKKFAILIHLSESKLTHYYTQIEQAIAGRIQLFDHDKDILIFNTPEECEFLSEWLNHVPIENDQLELLWIPTTTVLYAMFSDYGFTSQDNRHYLYNHLVAVFHFCIINELQSEPDQALLQMEEYFLARYSINDIDYYVIDHQFESLLSGIAKAYHCAIEFIIN